MQKIIYLPALILIILVSSCATLSRTEISNLDRIGFEPLILKPGFESNDLRIDLIRQSYDNQINDSTVENQDQDYRPLGFDLGNGIFYDLNHNLSFRLDYLLGVSGEDCWSVQKISKRKQRRADLIYSICNDSLTVIYPPGRRKRYLHHLVKSEGTISLMHRNRLRYSIEIDDQTAVYRYKTRKLDVIRKSDENHYTIMKGLWKESFRLQENSIMLDNDYVIKLSDNNKKLQIMRPGWLQPRVVLTIEKSRESLYIYDRSYQGRKIQFYDTGLSVYQNRTFVAGWELIRVPE